MVRIYGAVILATVAGIVFSWLGVNRLELYENSPAVVPRPAHLEVRPGKFILTPGTRIVVDESSASEGELLAERLRNSIGYAFPVDRSAECRAGAINLTTTDARPDYGPEGYRLEVRPDMVVVRAKTSAGIFYGTQSLLQLFPTRVFSTRRVGATNWGIRCVCIEDRPRFGWRGFMLDVSRHFFKPGEVKRVLDLMAMQKLNTFHWHLTDDQGWRIEIRSYPRLTQVGAWRKCIGFNLDPTASSAYGPDGRYGGFYTQAEIREIIAYAQCRHITIIPEIDLPGHASAALAAYPQFSCSGGPYTTDMSEAVSSGVFCPGNEESFVFVDKMLEEVMDLFPGPFIHVGGDEVCRYNWRNCPRCQARMAREGLKSEHELEGYFIKRVEQCVTAHGKRLIGWSEIRDGGLAQDTALMDWIGGGGEAAAAGHDVVMSPEPFCYLDFYQSKDRSTEPPAAGAFLPLQKVYSFEPIPTDLSLTNRGHILGAQGNLWTEYIPSLAQVEYMAFPRLSALAEVVWSPKQLRNWQDFERRLVVHEQRLDQLGVKYGGNNG